MNKNSLVSVIMPAYNAEKYIEQAVQSVVNQTYPNWELLIINDGSTDGTVSYLNKIQHPAIRVIHQANKGVSSARNAGLSVANGEFITFLDADDVLPDSSLEVRVNYLVKNPDIHIVGGRVDIWTDDFKTEICCKKPEYCGKFLPKLLKLDAQVFSSICYLVRKNILRNVRFKEGMTHCEDLLFWIELSVLENVNYGSVSSSIYKYRTSNTSATSDATGWRNGYFELIKQINKNPNIRYYETIYTRIRIIYILLLWHIKKFKN